MRRVRSLQLRLAIRLSALFLAATTVIVCVFLYRSYEEYGDKPAPEPGALTAYTEPFFDSLLVEFFTDAGWIIALLVLITIALGVLVVRSGLKPIREISRIASSIGPNNTSVRLPQDQVPSEIIPLVVAVNYALERLEQGFVVQKQFTANAAHELRTPLAIVTSALETARTVDELEKIKADVARMNRLVEQLLRVARLDDVGLDTSAAIDLNKLAAASVETLAPWALGRNRRLALVVGDAAVMVKGNAPAIEDALRNLIENAVTYSPLQAEVVVEVSRDCKINVVDQGAGISAQDKQTIFERFSRGHNAQAGGAGLGLAIVRDIMTMHAGTVSVVDNPTGGSIFALAFPTA